MSILDQLAGKYVSTGPMPVWDHRIDLDVLHDDDTQQWTLRYNDRKYALAPTTILDIVVDETGTVSFEDAKFPNWIARKSVRASGTFSICEDGPISLRLTQVNQGMTALETWTVTLRKQRDNPPGQSPEMSRKTSKLLELVRSGFSAPNSEPTQPQINALAIYKKGEIVLEEYFGDMTPETLHIISSCTKSITSILAGIALDQSLFDLKDKVVDYFPDVKTSWGGDGNKQPVLIRHVLSMTAGTEHTVKDAQDLLESECVEDLVLGWPLAASPGQRYDYDNGLPSLIGRLVEVTSAMPLGDFADKHLFGPLGLATEKDFAWTAMPTAAKHKYHPEQPISAEDQVLAAGGMLMTLPAFLKVGQMLLQDGMYDGKRIVSSQYIKEATRQRTKRDDYPYGLYFHLNQRDTDDTAAVREWVHLDGVDGYFMLGQGEQVLFVSPKEHLVVAAFSSSWHKDKNAEAGKYAIMEVIKAALGGI